MPNDTTLIVRNRTDREKTIKDATNAIGLYMRAGIGPRFPTNTEENKKKTRKDMAVAQINALPTTPEESAIVVPVEVAHCENTPCGNNPQTSLRFLNSHPELCSN